MPGETRAYRAIDGGSALVLTVRSSEDGRLENEFMCAVAPAAPAKAMAAHG